MTAVNRDSMVDYLEIGSSIGRPLSINRGPYCYVACNQSFLHDIRSH